MGRTPPLFVLVILSSVALSGCANPEPTPRAEVLVVDPVILPFAERFADGAFTVGVLEGRSLERARLVVVDSARDAEQARELLAERKHGKLPWVLDIAEDVPPAERPDGSRDPMHWIDPVRSIELVRNLMWGFVTVDPDRRAQYEERAAALTTALEGTHDRFLEATAQCESRHMLVDVPRYGHWVHRYNLYQHGIGGRSEEELRELVERLDITALFHDADTAPPAVAASLELEPIAVALPGDYAALPGVSGHFATLDAAAEALRDGLRC